MLFPALEEASNSEAIRFGERALTYSDIRGVVGNVARQLEGVERVAVWALPALETCPAVLGALAAGVPVVPINPKSGQRELEHVVSDSGPARDGGRLPQESGGEAPAIVIYHVRDDGSSEGRCASPPGDLLQPRRACGRVGLDRA
jgi:malonyl-CoA/methylmalonyl-CoA synthetase